MKKILVSCIGTNLGGVERSLIEFLRFLTTEDCEIDLVHWKKPGELYKQIPDSVYILPRLAPMGISDIKKLRNPLRICRELVWYAGLHVCKAAGKPWACFKRLPKHYDIAISYCQNGYSPYYIIDKVRADTKYLWYHHGSYEQTGRKKKQDEAYYLRYDRVVTVSRANVEMLTNAIPSLRGRMECIHNLIDEEAICAKAKEPIEPVWGNGIRIATVGRLSPEKGQLFALDVAAYLKQHGLAFTWVFVGDGPDRDACEMKIRALGLTECILVGAKANPYPYMEQADLYVQPSYVEADPITIREAKVLGKTILSSDIPALCEALQNGKYGTMCPLNVDRFGALLHEKATTWVRDCAKNTYPSDNIRIRQEIKRLILGE